MKSTPSNVKLEGGKLLVANPELEDPLFARSLIYLAAHDQEGSIGFIMNRPVNRPVGEVATLAEKELESVPLYLGGPVDPERLCLVYFSMNSKDDTSLLCDIGLSQETLLEKMKDEDGAVMAFLGYAGWTGDQLSNEIQENSWMVREPTSLLLRPSYTCGLWFSYLQDDGAWRKWVPYLPKDIQLN